MMNKIVLNIVRYLYHNRVFYLAILIPLIYIPLPFYYSTQAMKCGYVCLVTASFLVTQVLPLAVASLLPVLLFPLMGILSMKDVSSQYMKDPIMLFFSSLIIARAIETVNLHRRLALTLLYISGSKPIWLLLGFLGTTFFISMWINNTATAALMTPIAVGVMREFVRIHSIDPHGGGKIADGEYVVDETALDNETSNIISQRGSPLSPPGHTASQSPPNADKTVQIITDHANESPSTSPSLLNLDGGLLEIKKAIFISIAFASNLGGTASLTGTGPNIIMAGLMIELFGNKASIGFGSWLFYSFPGAFVILCLMWIYMCIYFIGFGETFTELMGRRSKYLDARPFIKNQLKQLGSIREEEIIVGVTFIILLLVWIMKNPKFMPGWQSWFRADYVSDSSPAMMMAVLYFVLPMKLRSLKYIWNPDGVYAAYQPILNWPDVQKNLMWDIIILFGGGLAIAAGFKASGLSSTLIESFKVFRNLNPFWTVLMFSTITSALTEVLSNISTASILVPLMAEMAVSVRVHPYYFVFPVTMASSYSFMLPIATGPNAIVYTAGNLSFWDMVKPGFVVNLIGVIVSCVSINTYAKYMIGTGVFPAWAQTGRNVTSLIS